MTASAEQGGEMGIPRNDGSHALLIDAFTKVAAERSYARTTVEEVERQADVPRGPFTRISPTSSTLSSPPTTPPSTASSVRLRALARGRRRVTGPAKFAPRLPAPWSACTRRRVALASSRSRRSARGRPCSSDALPRQPASPRNCARVAAITRSPRPSRCDGVGVGRRRIRPCHVSPTRRGDLAAAIDGAPDLSALLLAPYAGPAEASAIIRIS
jgi:hypothetical protein